MEVAFLRVRRHPCDPRDSLVTAFVRSLDPPTEPYFWDDRVPRRPQQYLHIFQSLFLVEPCVGTVYQRILFRSMAARCLRRNIPAHLRHHVESDSPAFCTVWQLANATGNWQCEHSHATWQQCPLHRSAQTELPRGAELLPNPTCMQGCAVLCMRSKCVHTRTDANKNRSH